MTHSLTHEHCAHASIARATLDAAVGRLLTMDHSARDTLTIVHVAAIVVVLLLIISLIFVIVFIVVVDGVVVVTVIVVIVVVISIVLVSGSPICKVRIQILAAALSHQ